MDLIETPGALERQIHRIHELLESVDAEVVWNDHLPDPDNPSQPRQIDITIRRDGQLTIIECRLSARRQDVKWIEELIGRCQSLEADVVIAVASAGFTKGAQKKATRFGVLLRDLRRLTDDEIANWGRQVALTIYFYHYSDLTLSVGFAEDLPHVIDELVLKQELQSHPVLQSVFNAAAQQIDTLKLLTRADQPTVRFRVRVAPEEVVLLNKLVVQMALEGNARLVVQPIYSPAAFTYGSPTQNVGQRDAVVERFSLGETSIVHQGEKIATEIDLSAWQPPPGYSQLRFFQIVGEKTLDHESFALRFGKKVQLIRGGGPLNVCIYRTPN